MNTYDIIVRWPTEKFQGKFKRKRKERKTGRLIISCAPLQSRKVGTDCSLSSSVTWDTVIHRLMIHHHPMIHFCKINNFLKNAYIFMKQIFLNTYIYSLPTVQIWQGLNKFQAWCILIKSGCFSELAKKGPTIQ